MIIVRIKSFHRNSFVDKHDSSKASSIMPRLPITNPVELGSVNLSFWYCKIYQMRFRKTFLEIQIDLSEFTLMWPSVKLFKLNLALLLSTSLMSQFLVRLFLTKEFPLMTPLTSGFTIRTSLTSRFTL